jgi:tetratricopeptide (TPR) repeat protein
MSSPSASPIELEVGRIRDLSKTFRHSEALAAAETLEVVVPHNRDVLYLIAANQRCLNRIPEALATLERLEQQHPRYSLLYQERGYCYMTLRDARRAIDAFLRCVDLNPALAASWTMLERLYRMTGEIKNAAAAAEHVSGLKDLPPEIVRAGSLFSDGDLLRQRTSFGDICSTPNTLRPCGCSRESTSNARCSMRRNCCSTAL